MLVTSIFSFSVNVFYHSQVQFQSDSHQNCCLKMLSSWTGLKFLSLWKELTHSHTMTPFDAPGKQAFCKHCGKRRNCSSRAISPFPTVFSSFLNKFLPFSSDNAFKLDRSKIFVVRERINHLDKTLNLPELKG